MTSFTVQYNLDKRSRQILPDGTEEYPDDAGQWALFQLAEETRQAAAEAAAAENEDQDKDTAPIVEQRSPQAVIDTLFAARGELDVIFDLITAIKQQQFVSLSHVPTTKDPARVAREAALRLARRREQLRSTADRIRTGTAAAREQVHIADRFLQDLKEIRKEWRVCRRSAASGGNPAGSFYVDLSLPIERGLVRFGNVETTHVNIVPSSEGIACIVVVVAPDSESGSGGDGGGGGISTTAATPGVKIIKGPQNISEELKRRHIYHSWNEIQTVLLQEIKKGTTSNATNFGAQQEAGARRGAQEAILRMAATATTKKARILTDYYNRNTAVDVIEEKEQEGMGLDGEDTAMLDAVGGIDAEEEEDTPLENNNTISEKEKKTNNYTYSAAATAEKGFAAQDIDVYCSTATSQIEFESLALRCLAHLCREAQTPALIKETRGGGGGEVSNSMLDQLTGWLRHAALCYAVQTSLTRQIQRLSAAGISVDGVNVTLAAAQGIGVDKKWLISRETGGSIGVLAVESGVLRWYGPLLRDITGQGQELGRAQLENFIEIISQLTR